MDRTERLLVGTYGEAPALRLARRTASGGWQTDGAVSDTRNASFAVWSARHHRLYVVREEPEGAIDVLVGDSEWRKVGSFPTLGAEPCHCALDASETFLAAANYGSGSVTVWRLGTDGMPEGEPWLHQGHGSGPDPKRQDGPHAHWVGFTPDQRWLAQTDLGTDRVLAFPFDPNRGITGAPQTALESPPGSGPRWLSYTANDRALLVNELDSTLTLLAWSEGWFDVLDRRTTRANNTEGDNLGGHLLTSCPATRAYVTNRGDDSVAVFAIKRDTLELLQTVPSGGASPRVLCLVDGGSMLLVGHEQKGPVTAFAIGRGGELRRLSADLPITAVAWMGAR